MELILKLTREREREITTKDHPQQIFICTFEPLHSVTIFFMMLTKRETKTFSVTPDHQYTMHIALHGKNHIIHIALLWHSVHSQLKSYLLQCKVHTIEFSRNAQS